jgi:hypothetical protein
MAQWLALGRGQDNNNYFEFHIGMCYMFYCIVLLLLYSVASSSLYHVLLYCIRFIVLCCYYCIVLLHSLYTTFYCIVCVSLLSK